MGRFEFSNDRTFTDGNAAGTGFRHDGQLYSDRLTASGVMCRGPATARRPDAV